LNGYRPRKKRSKKYPDYIDLRPLEKTEIPQWQDVHIPVEQAEPGHTVRLKAGNPGAADTLYQLHAIKSGKPGRGLLAILTLKDSPYGGKLELPLSSVAEVVTHDPVTGALEQFKEYFYSEDLKVVRCQWTDRRAVYNGKTKEIRPYHRGQDGKWILGKGDGEWPLYCQNEASLTIRQGGIVLAVGGEETVEALRSLGLTATCNQGGEGGYRQIARNLAKDFKLQQQFESVDNQIDQQMGESGLEWSKPLLVSWPDNDETGRKTFGEGLPKDCYAQGVTSVVINPLSFWPDMSNGDDASNWIEFCRKSSVSNEQIYRILEFAIDSAIDEYEEELRHRWQRDAWDAPTSYKGEIGRWVTSGKGENAKREWKPLANFDFVVERELEDSSGGGLVLQVKRSFDQRQYRVLLNSTDYTTSDKFVDAMKSALGVGVSCNLSKFDLNALLHTRLHEYRTNRQGKLYKRIERYGQQEDGTWVFRDRQFTPDGNPTSEDETRWVFNPALGKDDFIPCPELAPADPLALKRLVDAARRFFGLGNIYQALLTIGWVVAGLHSQEIFKQDGSFALFNSFGEPGSCKTFTAETALSLIGSNWPTAGMLAKTSTSALYEHGSKTGSLPFFWDDPERTAQNEELMKTWYNRKPRKVRGNNQTPHSPMGVTSNHVAGGDQAATYTRFIRNPHERKTGGDKQAFQELKQAQLLASGAFPTLLKLGYPRDKIVAIESELLTHLPLAHARIAQSMAIVVYYAQQVVELVGGTEDIKTWVISHLCTSEDDADSIGDSLQDFIDKVLSLESESLIGDWNKQTVTTRDGQQYIALHYADVWSLVDKHYKPATYNLKALKPLVVKAGGRVDNVTQKFDLSRDQTLAYYRALISPRTDGDGATVEPNPPRKVGRKSWLLPTSLFNHSDDGNGDDGGNGGDDPISPDPHSPVDDGGLSQIPASYQNSPDRYQQLPKSGNSPSLDRTSTSATANSQVTKLPIIEAEIEIEIDPAEQKEDIDCHNEHSNNSVTLVTAVTQSELEAVTQQVCQFQRVTGFCNSLVSAHHNPSQPEPAPIDVTQRNGTQRAVTPPAVASDPIPTEVVAASEPLLKVGDSVIWDNAPGHLASWNPFTIVRISDDTALLDIYSLPVPLSELRRVE
jgi:hypothetical protein